jgi:hypothetical protein
MVRVVSRDQNKKISLEQGLGLYGTVHVKAWNHVTNKVIADYEQPNLILDEYIDRIGMGASILVPHEAIMNKCYLGDSDAAVDRTQTGLQGNCLGSSDEGVLVDSQLEVAPVYISKKWTWVGTVNGTIKELFLQLHRRPVVGGGHGNYYYIWPLTSPDHYNYKAVARTVLDTPIAATSDSTVEITWTLYCDFLNPISTGTYEPTKKKYTLKIGNDVEAPYLCVSGGVTVPCWTNQKYELGRMYQNLYTAQSIRDSYLWPLRGSEGVIGSDLFAFMGFLAPLYTWSSLRKWEYDCLTRNLTMECGYGRSPAKPMYLRLANSTFEELYAGDATEALCSHSAYTPGDFEKTITWGLTAAADIGSVSDIHLCVCQGRPYFGYEQDIYLGAVATVNLDDSITISAGDDLQIAVKFKLTNDSE